MTTLPQQDTIKQYIADGVTTEFVVPFYTPESTITGEPAINVYVTLEDETPIPEDDIKIWNVDYTYAPNADPITGGTLTFLTGKIPPLDSSVTLSRNVPAELSVEFADAQNFSGANLDDVLEQLLLITQQNKTYALQRNLSYRVNSLLPSADIEAQCQIPVLGENQIWQGTGDGVAAVTLEENPDVSTLRSELENDSPGTDGARIVGYYDALFNGATTVHDQLDFITGNIRLMGTDTGALNAMVLTIANNDATYVTGMEIRIIPANTNTGATTINFNALGVKSIYRDNSVAVQPGDFIAGKLYSMVYDGSKFILSNSPSIRSGMIEDFGGAAVPAGYLNCDGSAVSRTTYAALFTAIGTTWGIGDGSSTFNLPNFERCVSVGSGGSGSATLGNAVGDTGGEEDHVQTIAEMAQHSHTSTVGGVNGSATAAPWQSALGTSTAQTDTIPLSVGLEGDGDPFNIMQPSNVVLKIIKI
ncbi:phage tail protein [Candidatus Parcubacteria bacterium]|nr:phage tail protein [Candidatus Parcubacteria bacterium]